MENIETWNTWDVKCLNGVMNGILSMSVKHEKSGELKIYSKANIKKIQVKAEEEIIEEEIEDYKVVDLK